MPVYHHSHFDLIKLTQLSNAHKQGEDILQ